MATERTYGFDDIYTRGRDYGPVGGRKRKTYDRDLDTDFDLGRTTAPQLEGEMSALLTLGRLLYVQAAGASAEACSIAGSSTPHSTASATRPSTTRVQPLSFC